MAQSDNTDQVQYRSLNEWFKMIQLPEDAKVPTILLSKSWTVDDHQNNERKLIQPYSLYTHVSYAKINHSPKFGPSVMVRCEEQNNSLKVLLTGIHRALGEETFGDKKLKDLPLKLYIKNTDFSFTHFYNPNYAAKIYYDKDYPEDEKRNVSITSVKTKDRDNNYNEKRIVLSPHDMTWNITSLTLTFSKNVMDRTTYLGLRIYPGMAIIRKIQNKIIQDAFGNEFEVKEDNGNNTSPLITPEQPIQNINVLPTDDGFDQKSATLGGYDSEEEMVYSKKQSKTPPKNTRVPYPRQK